MGGELLGQLARVRRFLGVDALGGETLAHLGRALNALDQRFASLFCFGAQPSQFGHLPVTQHDWFQDLIMMDEQVVDPRTCDFARHALIVRNTGTWHFEIAYRPLDGNHRGRRIDLEGRRRQVAVEEVVEVLVVPTRDMIAVPISSFINLPVLRCEIRVASSCMLT